MITLAYVLLLLTLYALLICAGVIAVIALADVPTY